MKVDDDTLYLICIAYEQGFGWGIGGRPNNNPYSVKDENGHRAWRHGYDLGAERRDERAKAPPDPHHSPQGNAPTLIGMRTSMKLKDALAEIAALKTERDKLRAAVCFYADTDNWTGSTVIDGHNGDDVDIDIGGTWIVSNLPEDFDDGSQVARWALGIPMREDFRRGDDECDRLRDEVIHFLKSQ
ncbi:hypothetical protein D9623_33905 (plasmid) [Azospirillum brasilense]|uniref:Uncharacterized protein n=2 Tax=root TaxID=1 RepID=A0A4D8QUV9_AZOBR|nr:MULTISPECIES: hypothetical protein [Azospirillum]MDW7555438.1 hypothetical protein [Azospirillum brasilense]MDW7595154.1 hypothetical protein [Azospirillum brasilense]MDW7630307.1 hypothetical protein [Azospirillum brasilense]MDX5949675.1 hypothetical protein [Azospirillum brasilense]QCO12900.1 hypothetical protein D3868_28235 [Azospirillum brasilense]